MSGFTPKFRIYDATGSTLLYTFFAGTSTNVPQSVRKTVAINNLRAQGDITIDGGEDSWDAILTFHIVGDDYQEVTQEIDTLESTILLNVPYILTLDKTPTTFFQFKVKRLEPFQYLDSLRLNHQEVTATFRVNSW